MFSDVADRWNAFTLGDSKREGVQCLAQLRRVMKSKLEPMVFNWQEERDFNDFDDLFPGALDRLRKEKSFSTEPSSTFIFSLDIKTSILSINKSSGGLSKNVSKLKICQKGSQIPLHFSAAESCVKIWSSEYSDSSGVSSNISCTTPRVCSKSSFLRGFLNFVTRLLPCTTIYFRFRVVFGISPICRGWLKCFCLLLGFLNFCLLVEVNIKINNRKLSLTRGISVKITCNLLFCQ